MPGLIECRHLGGSVSVQLLFCLQSVAMSNGICRLLSMAEALKKIYTCNPPRMTGVALNVFKSCEKFLPYQLWNPLPQLQLTGMHKDFHKLLHLCCLLPNSQLLLRDLDGLRSGLGGLLDLGELLSELGSLRQWDKQTNASVTMTADTTHSVHKLCYPFSSIQFMYAMLTL